ncbi:MAG TPA: hypothetical protein DDY68_05380, partial [Porphyromonadaceae bacterium]|nr:hypothetical protein [Porphyromonadaceae bacterium]
MERKENFKIKATFYKSFDNNANKLAVITEKSEFKPVMMIKNKLDFEKNREDLRKRILYHKPNEVSSKVSSDSEIQKIEEEKNKFKKSLGEITLKNEGINKLHWGESDFDTWVIDEKSLTNEGYIDDWYEIEYSEESVKKFVDKFLGPDNNPECDATDAKESFEDIINTDGIIKLSEAEKETKNILDELCKVCVSTKAKKEEFSKYVGAEFKRYFGELKFQVNEWKKIEEQYYNSELYKSKGCVVGETNLPFTSEPSTDCFDRVISDRKNKIIDKFSEDFFLGNIELFNKCAHKVDSEGKSLETDAFDKYEIVYKSCRYHKCVFKPGELELVLEVKPLGNLNSAVYPIKEDIDQLKEKCITLERGTNDHDFNSVAEKFIVFNVDTILGDCTKDSINGWDGNNVGYTIKIRAYSIDKYLTLNKHSKCYTGKKPIDILTDVFYHFGIIREGEDKYETTNVTPYKLNFTTKYLKHLSESKLSFEGVEKKYRDICKNERGTVVCVGNPFKSGEAKINGVLKKVYFFDRESACDFYDENGKKVEELDKRDVFNEEYIYDMDDSYIYEEDVDKDVEVEELDGV